MAINVDIGYAQALKHWGIGCPLYKPILAVFLKVGWIGYLTPQGWTRLLDLSDSAQMKARGLTVFNYAATPPPTVGDGLDFSVFESSNVKGTKIGGDIKVTVPLGALKLGLNTGAQFQTTGNNTAILFTTAPVVNEFWTADTEIEDWMKENAVGLLTNFPNAGRYGLFVVTSVWRTSKADTYWMNNSGTKINFFFEGDVQDVAKASINAQWYAAREDTGRVGTFREGEHVVGFSGQPFVWHNKVVAFIRGALLQSRNPKPVRDRLVWLLDHLPTIRSQKRIGHFGGGTSYKEGLQGLVPELRSTEVQLLYPSLRPQPGEEEGLLHFEEAPPGLDGEQQNAHKSRLEASAELLPMLNDERAVEHSLVVFNDLDEGDEHYLLQAEMTRNPATSFDSLLHMLSIKPTRTDMMGEHTDDYQSEDEIEEEQGDSPEAEGNKDDVPADSEDHKEKERRAGAEAEHKAMQAA